MKPLVTLERHGDVAVIVIDNPPVNALSIPLRRDLLAAVQEVAADKVLRAAVIACAGRTFVAGADIREFDAPPPEVTTGTVNAAIEASAQALRRGAARHRAGRRVRAGAGLPRPHPGAGRHASGCRRAGSG